MSKTAAHSAGQRLRKSLDDAPAAVSQQTGRAREWDESEMIAIETAMRAADRSEELVRLYQEEMEGKARPTSLTRYSAEMRLLDKQVIDCVARVNVGLRQGIKSPQHQRAANARWSSRPGRPGVAPNGA